MPRKRKLKQCIQCEEWKIERGKDGNFYKVTRFRTAPRCKACIATNNRLKRYGDSTERLCKKCNVSKPMEEFKSTHANSYCNDCSVIKKRRVIRLNDKTEDVCIVCNKVKSRESFRKLFKSGSKCIACVEKKKRERKKAYCKEYFEKISNTPRDKGKCKECREVKDREHFTEAKNYNGLSKICNECKERSKKIRERIKEEKRQEKEKIKNKKIEDKLKKKIDTILEKYPDSKLISEGEYAGNIITLDWDIRTIRGKRIRGLGRKLEHLYFQYLRPDLSMDEYYLDFNEKKLVKFGELSDRGRPSDNVNRIRKIERDKKRNDPTWKLMNAMTSSFCQWMKQAGGDSTWSRYINYTKDELKEHLEKQFTEGMSWDNFGWDGWWVDHIIPRSSFDPNNIEEMKQCWALSNLQPMWKKDNMSKGNRC